MKIAIVIDKLWGAHGGTEGQLLMLARNLDPEKFSVHLFCLRDAEFVRTATLPCPYTVMHIGSLISPATIGKLEKFRRLLRSHQVDVIQTYFDDAFIFGAVAGRLAGLPVIACRRNLGPAFWGKSTYLRAFRWIQPLTSRYIVNSKATGQAIASSESIPSDKISVIYNGLDMSRFEVITPDYRSRQRTELGLEEQHVLVGMVSHVRPGKNIELFVEAARRLREAFPKVRWMIVGEGVYLPRLRQLVQEHNLHEIILLPGATMDVVPYLAAMDIAVLTSDGESFSNAVIEYLAAGLPAVAAGVGGSVEALQENGFLFPPGNLNRLTEVLTYLITNRPARLEAGAKGRLEAARKYSVNRMVNAHEAIYSAFSSQSVQNLVATKK